MNWLVYHVASGQAFFSGVALVILAAVVSLRAGPVRTRIIVLALPVGIIAVAVSSTAIPYWYYGVALAATSLWAASSRLLHWRSGSVGLMVGVWAIAGLLEVPYHISPRLQPAATRSLGVVGDSVTAGMGGSDTAETWPNILAREHGLVVQDNSHPGETTASALRRLQQQPITAPVVLLEIGGNDLLGSTRSARFAADLDALLAQVTAADRQVVMLELPLPPFHHEYGRIQRALARKHGVLLVPKRVFLSVLAGGNSTVDTIHLTQAGHRQMARRVWQIVGPAFGESAERP